MIINSQLGGKKPTGTMYIISNGTYNVADKAIANVQVPTAAIIKYGADARAFLGDLDANGILQKPTTPTDLVFTGVKGFSAYDSTIGVFFRRFQNLESIKSVSFPDLENITTPYALANAFSGCTALTSVDISSLQTITGSNAFESAFSGCTALTSVNLSNLTSITGSNALKRTFSGCTALTSVDLSGLVNVNHSGSVATNTFSGCSSLTNLNISNLTTIDGNQVFASFLASCTGIVNLDLSSLTTIGRNIMNDGSCFQNFLQNASNFENIDLRNLKTVKVRYPFSRFIQGTKVATLKFQSLSSIPAYLVFENSCLGATYLQNVYFYALSSSSFGGYTDQFSGMLSGLSNVTVHFPMSIQSTIGSWSDITSGMGGTNTTVLFDIVTTLVGADSVSYARQEKDSTSSATAWVYNNTLYYTSGTTEPAVSDTIYSDAACTTAVTTISSIA